MDENNAEQFHWKVVNGPSPNQTKMRKKKKSVLSSGIQNMGNGKVGQKKDLIIEPWEYNKTPAWVVLEEEIDDSPSEKKEAPCEESNALIPEKIPSLKDLPSEKTEELLEVLKAGLENELKQKPKRGFGRLVFFIIVFVLVGLSIWRVASFVMTSKELTGRETFTNVMVQTVATSPISVTTSFFGPIEPKDQVSVYPALAGEVLSLNVAPGDVVSKGTVLFTVDSSQAQSYYNQLQASYNAAKKGAKIAKENLDRLQRLYEAGKASKSDYQLAETQYKHALSSRNQAKASRDQAAHILKQASVTAPMDGVITSVALIQGGYATQGTPALCIGDNRVMGININLPEPWITKINIGQKADVFISSLGSQPFEGTVVRMADTPIEGTALYPITIEIAGQDSRVRFGMFAEAQLTIGSEGHVITVPAEAIIEKDGISMAALVKEDTVEFRQVKTGLNNGFQVEVAEGLSEGEKIIVKGQTYVGDGQMVNVVQ